MRQGRQLAPSSGGAGYSDPPYALHVELVHVRPASCALRLYSAACSAPRAFARGHAIMPFRIRRNRPKLVERNPEMLGKLRQRSGQYPTGVVDGMATDDTKGDRDHLLWFR